MGTADAMRRQILPSMAQFFNEKQARGEKVAHLDVATGTGRFLSFVLQNYPDLKATCLDLSPFYLADAKTLLSKKHPQVQYCEAAAEKMPFPDNSFDSISCVYLFHELPHEVRVAVVDEMARVLKPGGRVFFVDSAQKGEVPADRVLEGFTIIAHEPYYLNYTEEDLSSLFRRAGFEVNTSNVEWVSKCMTFTKNG
jgi:ubiquinone/menaquinone biosynthesis C-methylase UbiE